MDYQIEAVTKDDKLRILNFLKKFFFRDEPLNQSVQLLSNREDFTCRDLENYSLASLENDLNLMAVLPNGVLIGVVLNGKNLIYVYQVLTIFSLFIGIFTRKLLELRLC